MTKRTLLWIGDAGVSTGFARATHKTLDVLREDFTVAALALHHVDHRPDLGEYPYPIFTSRRLGDMGVSRVNDVVNKIGPAVVVVQNDPWNVPAYVAEISGVPTVGAIAVDGLNCQGRMLNGLTHAIFWTAFAEREARIGGYAGGSSVIPLGVDLDVYRPISREAARAFLKIPEWLERRNIPQDAFIACVVGRNQPRKRLDLTIQYFAEWIHSRRIADACLWLHVAPTGEVAYDIPDLARYYKVTDRICAPPVTLIDGVPEGVLVMVYNACDALFTTTQGEGFHLPALEAMACGRVVIAPDWSALGDWARPAAVLVPCSSTAVTPKHGNRAGFGDVIGGVMDRDQAIEALDYVYRNRAGRQEHAAAGLALAREPRFRWAQIGRAFSETIQREVFGTVRAPAVAGPSVVPFPTGEERTADG